MGVFTDFMDKNEDKMSDADDYMVENDEEYDLVNLRIGFLADFPSKCL